MPRTQSALLEAMAERQVTVDGVTRAAAGAVPRHRDREPDRAGGDVPAPRGAARPVRAALGARLSVAGRGGRDRRRAAARASARDARAARRRGRRRDAPGRGRGRLRRRPRARVDRRPRPRDARGRGRLDRRLRPRQPHARAHRARAGRCCRDATTSFPPTSSALFLPVLGHRLLLTASFVAETRALGRARGAADDHGALPRARAAARRPDWERGLDEPPGSGPAAPVPERKAPAVSARPASAARRASVRRPAEPPPRPRQRRDRHAAVRDRRPGLDDRLVRERAALGRDRPRRVHRPRPRCRRGAARRRRLRPQARDGHLRRRRCRGSRSRARSPR